MSEQKETFKKIHLALQLNSHDDDADYSTSLQVRNIQVYPSTLQIQIHLSPGERDLYREAVGGEGAICGEPHGFWQGGA